MVVTLAVEPSMRSVRMDRQIISRGVINNTHILTLTFDSVQFDSKGAGSHSTTFFSSKGSVFV